MQPASTTTHLTSWPEHPFAEHVKDTLLERGWAHDEEESDLILSFERPFPAAGVRALLSLAEAMSLEPAMERCAFEYLAFFSLDSEPVTADDPLPFGDVPAEVREQALADLRAAIEAGR